MHVVPVEFQFASSNRPIRLRPIGPYCFQNGKIDPIQEVGLRIEFEAYRPIFLFYSNYPQGRSQTVATYYLLWNLHQAQPTFFHFSWTLRNSINLKFSTVINNYSYNYRYYHSILSLCAYRPYSVGLWGSYFTYLQADRITILGMTFSLNKNHSRISVEYVRHTLIFRLAVGLIG